MKKALKNNKQLVHKKTTTTYIALPKSLVLTIQNLNLSKTDKSHCFKFVGLLLRDSLEEHGDLSSFTPKPQEYLKKAFDNSYGIWLSKLLSNQIVVRSDFYSNEDGICYDYLIPSSFFSNHQHLNTLCIYNTYEPLSIVGYKDIIKGIGKEYNMYYNWFVDDLESLEIDYDKLQYILDDKLNNITIRDFEVNDQIQAKSIQVTTNVKSVKKKFYIKTADAIEMAHKQCKSLINDEDTYKIDSVDEFIFKKKLAITFSYQNSIARLQNKSYNTNRNKTNNRLDTNFTNMSSLLVDEICLQNDLVQIDLSNSQFVLLANHLKNKLFTDDYLRFKELSVSGNLYSYIQQELGLKSISEAKNAMFEIMFSSRNNRTTSKAKLKELFPSVLQWIDDYKKTYGDNKFSIMLQKIESDVFIDAILKRVKKDKYFCLTKHDSLIVRRKDYDAIMVILKDEFARIGLEYSLKITNLNGFNLEQKILWNESIEIESIQEQSQVQADDIFDELDLDDMTHSDVKSFGYSKIPFKNNNGDTLYVPNLYIRYWDKIRTKGGSMKKLQREYDQVGFDIELKRVIDDIKMIESAYNFFSIKNQ